MTGGASPKRSGTRSEHRVRDLFEAFGWRVVRSGGSLGEADLACLKAGKVILVQVKRRAGQSSYRTHHAEIAGFPVHAAIDFGRGNIRIDRSGALVSARSQSLRDFLHWVL